MPYAAPETMNKKLERNLAEAALLTSTEEKIWVSIHDPAYKLLTDRYAKERNGLDPVTCQGPQAPGIGAYFPRLWVDDARLKIHSELPLAAE